MEFFKQHWFKMLILLPIIPVGILIHSIERFTGISEILRLLGSLVLIIASLLILFLGLYLELNKHRNQKIRIGRLRISIPKILRSCFSLVVIAFIYIASNLAITSLRLENILTDIAIPTDQLERNYSLVTMADFDADNQRSHGDIGILSSLDDAKEIALEDFLATQEFILNPSSIAFDSPFELLYALYSNEVDAVIVTSNFASIFQDLEGFDAIVDETIVLATFSVESQIVEREQIEPGEPFSVLLLGLNTAGELFTGQINTFMLLTINLENMSFTITSVPRDSYVAIPCQNYTYDKLSHTNIGGASCAVGAIEHMFDIEIPYYVKLNFAGFMEMIDILGGIEVDVPIAFSEQDSRRRFGEHMIHLEAGLQRLNGEEALALSRHRDSFLTQDFVRVENQQLVFEAMLREMLTATSSVNDLLPLLAVIGRNVQTNFTTHELTLLAQYMIEYLAPLRHANIMEEIHLMNMVILGDVGSISQVNGLPMSVVFPWGQRIQAARALMMINLGLMNPQFNFAFAFDGFARPVRRWAQVGTYGDGTIPQGVQLESPAFEPEANPLIPEPIIPPPDIPWDVPGQEDPGPDLLPEPSRPEPPPEPIEPAPPEPEPPVLEPEEPVEDNTFE